MKDKIILAFQENHADLLRARRGGDREEEFYCNGYEDAMLFVLIQLGINYDEALTMKVKG